MALFNLIGATYQSSSLNADAEATWNLFPEQVESGTGKTAAILLGTPGLVDFALLPTSPVRGLWAGYNRLFAVAGSKLYELSSTGAIIGLGGPTDHTARGDVGDDAAHSPVQIFPNGQQLLIISSGFAYVDNGAGPVLAMYPTLTGHVSGGGVRLATVPNYGYGLYYAVEVVPGSPADDSFDPKMTGQPITLTGATGNPNTVVQVIDLNNILVLNNPGALANQAWTSTPAVTSRSGAFLDGYFIVSTPFTKQINISAINDGTSWDPLDFANKEGYPDNIEALLADHEELWLFGDETTEVWEDTGGSASNTFPLQRNAGAFIPIGCAAFASPARTASGVIWLGSDARGGPCCYYAQGFVPGRVSTHAVENIWRTYATISDAEAFVYRDVGHEFYVLTFPSANATWVYDGLTGMWHQRGVWNLTTLAFDRVRYRAHTYVFGQHFVGDWSSGQVYTMSLDYYNEAGAPIRRVRVAPPRSGQQVSPYTAAMTGQEFYTFFQKLQLDYESGDSSSVQLILDWSDDGGHTYGIQLTITGDLVGNFAYRAIWRRLGKARDRTFRITMISTGKVAWIGAYLQSVVGTG